VITWNQWWDLKKETNEELVEAIKKNEEELVRDLLDESKQVHGMIANVNMKMERDETPLHWAVLSGNTTIINTLLNFYAEVNA
jgi:ankyrin repeat protein